MARPKEFDRDEVLDRAVDLFWRNGYEATSMADMVEALGIGRQSLYDTFGDKHALYLAALDRYLGGPGALGALPADVPVRKQLRAIFQTMVDRAVAHPERGLCMLGAAAVERCAEDDEVSKRFCRRTHELEDAFTRRLEQAKADGEIGAHHDPRGLARYLVNALYGLQLSARAHPRHAFLDPILDVTLSVLG